MRCPSPHHGETDSLERLGQVQDQRHRSLIFFLCFVFESFHLQQNLPHCSLCSSISAICSVPLNKVFLVPFRHCWCSQSLPPTNQRWHERNRPLAREVLWDREEHLCARLLRTFASVFHLFQELHNFPSHLPQIQGDSRVEAVASHPCLCLVQPRRFFSSSPSLSFGRTSSIFQGLSSKFCTSPSLCLCVANSVLFAHQPSILLFF